MQEEWKRCLQGIWCSFSFLLNFSRHTGHLTPLSGGGAHISVSVCWLRPLLVGRGGCPPPTCFLFRQDDHAEGLDGGLGGRRRKTLVPVRRIQRVHQVQTLHQGPGSTHTHWVSAPEAPQQLSGVPGLTWPAPAGRSDGTAPPGPSARSRAPQSKTPSWTLQVSTESAGPREDRVQVRSGTYQNSPQNPVKGHHRGPSLLVLAVLERDITFPSR